MSERQRARERADEVDIEVVWFGFLPWYHLFTLLIVISIAIFVSYVLTVGLPPLIPMAISVVTALGGGFLLSVRSTSTQVALATARRKSDDTETETVDVLPTIAGISTWVVGVMLLAVLLIQLIIVSVQISSVTAVTVIGMVGAIALVFSMIVGIQMTLEAIVANDGKSPTDSVAGCGT